MNRRDALYIVNREDGCQMEMIALSLLLMLVLTVFVGCLLAAEQSAVKRNESSGSLIGGGPAELIRLAVADLSRQVGGLAGLAGLPRRLAWLGCLIVLLAPLLAFAVIPLAPSLDAGEPAVMIAADLDAAVPFLLAMLAAATFGQMLVDEDAGQVERFQGRLIFMASVGLAALGIVRLTGTWRLDLMVVAQEELGVWWLARQPLGFAAMLLALVWWVFGTASPKIESREFDSNSAPFPYRLMQHVPLVLLAYLLVVLFAGGWHVWGFAGDVQSGWTVWAIQSAVLHLKVVLLLSWLIWLRYVRLPDAMVSAWRSRIGMAALIAGAANVIVAEFSEQYLAGHPDIWKAALAWGALMLALLTIGVFSTQIAPD